MLERVDRAFNRFLAQNITDDSHRPEKRRRIDVDTPAEIAGGFLIEDEPAGGFLFDDNKNELPSESDSIPLHSIPDALQYLDLPPDDEEVLSVFRNAASGWNNPEGEQDSGSSQLQTVSRKDFRAVCLILLGAEEEGVAMSSDAPPFEVESGEMDGGCEQSSPSSLSGIEDENEDGDDGEFLPETAVNPRKGKGKKNKGKSRAYSDSEDDLDSRPRPITSRQRRTCLEDFGRIFPTTHEIDLPLQKIMLKDIIRVAEQVKVKLKAEEMVEMITELSSSADKSMSLADFERMMIRAKLA